MDLARSGLGAASAAAMAANASSSLMARVTDFWRTGAVAGGDLHLCLNRCRRGRNGVCEDKGGSVCREGMDCSDCGVRTLRPVRPGGSSRRRAAWRRWVPPAKLTDVCLCTLMTSDRVPSLHRLARSWGHTLSVAYLADDFEADAARGLDLLLLDGLPVPHSERLTLSVVEDRGYRRPVNRFPFNLLRNVAVAASPADFVVLVDVDFVFYPPPSPTCEGCHAAAHLLRWLPLLALTPHLALVLPAFDPTPSVGDGASVARLSNKKELGQLLRGGRAESFAFTQYAMGHACDAHQRWLASPSPFLMNYSFGCEPYLLYNRRAAPRFWEMFVAYGKDRVSFTYELAARGFAFLLQPEVFLVHRRTVAATGKYAHAPEAWAVGETCWPDFENRIKLKYNYREGWCRQSPITYAVNTSIVNESIVCVAQVEGLCVLNCRPSVVRWGHSVRQQAQLQREAEAERRQAAAEGREPEADAEAEADERPPSRRLGALSSRQRQQQQQQQQYSRRPKGSAKAAAGHGGAALARAHKGSGPRAAKVSKAGASLRLEGTSSRPPKVAQAYAYSLARREEDRRQCCRAAPVAARCPELNVTQ